MEANGRKYKSIKNNCYRQLYTKELLSVSKENYYYPDLVNLLHTVSVIGIKENIPHT